MFLKYLEIIVNDSIDTFGAKFSTKLRFLVARAQLYIAGKTGRNLDSCLE